MASKLFFICYSRNVQLVQLLLTHVPHISATWLCVDAVQVFVYIGYLISTGQMNTVFNQIPMGYMYNSLSSHMGRKNSGRQLELPK